MGGKGRQTEKKNQRGRQTDRLIDSGVILGGANV
jgi:hypothetical protein